MGMIRLNKDWLFNVMIRFRRSASFPGFRSPGLRKKNRYKVFIAVKDVNWEKAGLIDSWLQLDNVEVVHYDWGTRYDQYSADWHNEKKQLFNEELIERVVAEHAVKPIDIFFSYLSGRWVFPETINIIRSMDIVAINISFDDRQSFWGTREATGYGGNAEIAPAYDVCITCQNRDDVMKYAAVGANPVFLPPAGNQNLFARSEPRVIRPIPVSFVGQKYGVREEIIEYLMTRGIRLCVRGVGWPLGAVSGQDMLGIYMDSLLTLGFGYVGGGTEVICLKGRDFEIPLTGTAYLTTYNKHLAEFFVEDEEILFYRDKRDLLEKIDYYTNHPDQAIKIGLAGRNRALREHTWDKRWRSVIDLCTI